MRTVAIVGSVASLAWAGAAVAGEAETPAVQTTQAAAPATQELPRAVPPDSNAAVQDRPASPDGSEAGIGAEAVPTGDWFEQAVDRFKEFHCVASDDGGFRLNTDFWLTQDFMVFDRPPPSLVRTGEWQTYWPQLNGLVSMEFGEHLSFVALGQVYRGFDPVDESLSANLSEYFAVIQPLDSAALVLKGGTFATCYGQWVNRHFSFQNPLINAPLMYEGMTDISDGSGNLTATPGLAKFLGRKNLAQNVAAWVPIIWGPSYASGGQIGGTWQNFDYAAELKNASLSSRPADWQFWEKDFSNPTLTGRVGWRPDAAWNLGVSGSGGSYLAADPLLTKPANAWDSTQTVVGADLSWAHGPLQVWSEFAFSRWRIPNLQPADAYSYFVEAKWKFAQQLWLAGRWNQQFYGDYPTTTGGTTAWGDQTSRVDVCLGWKMDRFVQLKAQYTWTTQVGFDQQSPSNFLLQLVVEF